jgi:poly(A) polymerase
MKEIWGLQPRFEMRAGKRPFGLLQHPRYRAAYDFLLLRCQSGEITSELADWWTAFANSDSEKRIDLLKPETNSKPRRRRSRRKQKSSQPSHES